MTRIDELAEKVAAMLPAPWNQGIINMPQSWDYVEINGPNDEQIMESDHGGLRDFDEPNAAGIVALRNNAAWLLRVARAAEAVASGGWGTGVAQANMEALRKILENSWMRGGGSAARRFARGMHCGRLMNMRLIVAAWALWLRLRGSPQKRWPTRSKDDEEPLQDSTRRHNPAGATQRNRGQPRSR